MPALRQVFLWERCKEAILAGRDVKPIRGTESADLGRCMFEFRSCGGGNVDRHTVNSKIARTSTKVRTSPAAPQARSRDLVGNDVAV